MSQATRRFSCRVGFVLFCLVPTLLVVSAILLVRSPYYQEQRRRALEQQLSQRLGVRVAVARWEPLERDGLLLRGVRLSDPETSRRLATVRVLEVRRSEQTWKLLASQPEIESSSLHRLWEVLHERLLRESLSEPLQAVFAARELTLRSDERSQTFTEIRGSLEPSGSGPQLSLEFRLAGTEMSEPARFRVVRNRQLKPPATGWALQTGSAALPCSLLAEQLPALKQLGPECRFQGSIWANRAQQGWQGDLSGRFLDLDLYNLVSEQFPHKLTGSARLLLTVARFDRGRLIEASGELRSDQGVVSQSLLLALRDELRLTLNTDALPVDDQRVLYQDLAIAFRLDEGGLGMAAVRDASQPGVMVRGDYDWLVAESAEPSVPVVALVRALVPLSRVLVPATRQTDPLLQALPVPQVQPASVRNARDLYSPLRLKTSGSDDTQP